MPPAASVTGFQLTEVRLAVDVTVPFGGERGVGAGRHNLFQTITYSSLARLAKFGVVVVTVELAAADKLAPVVYPASANGSPEAQVAPTMLPLVSSEKLADPPVARGPVEAS